MLYRTLRETAACRGTKQLPRTGRPINPTRKGPTTSKGFQTHYIATCFDVFLTATSPGENPSFHQTTSRSIQPPPVELAWSRLTDHYCSLPSVRQSSVLRCLSRLPIPHVVPVDEAHRPLLRRVSLGMACSSSWPNLGPSRGSLYEHQLRDDGPAEPDQSLELKDGKPGRGTPAVNEYCISKLCVE